MRSFPKSRTYLYRLAFRRSEKEFTDVIQQYSEVEAFHPQSKKIESSLQREQTLLPFVTDEGILEMRYFSCWLTARNNRPTDLASCFRIELTHVGFEDFKECLTIFEGVHNFSSFMNAKNLWNHRKKNPDFTEAELLRHFERKIDSIKVEEVAPPNTLAHLPIARCFRYVDVTVSGKSFLHNQVSKHRLITFHSVRMMW